MAKQSHAATEERGRDGEVDVPVLGSSPELAWDVAVDDLCYSVRPIRPDDAERLVTFHSHLSTHTSYLRYFHLHPVLSTAEVERFTHVDYHDRMALVAVVDDRIIGVGRYDRQSGTDEAEVAFVVGDEFQHHGIGSVLLDLLVVIARANGIATFIASTLVENRAMREVFEHSGFAPTWDTEYETMYVRFAIAPTIASRKAVALRDLARRMTRRAAGDPGPR